ncbi:MAG TPA: RNB domain-containing ribonuclease [Casimicrobiaceae bacterium]|jgi:exoribonuclease-2|nr:RNB domain-containing ribonuclease [Casimicrobiaceae bacterium]
MNVLFEDDGQLKAGTLLADHDASLSVEAVSGKRQKIKAAHVLLRFSEPSPAETLARAHELVAELDPNFLWEVVADDEFGFEELAREYYGAKPAPAQSAAVVLALARAPMYFYRKGRGRFRKAPPEALKAALASIARKEREAREIAQWVDELVANRLPPPLAAKLDMLLYKPDKNAPEWKALAAACDQLRTGPVHLLRACGAIGSSHEYHFRRFIVDAFPHGTDFPTWGALPALPEPPLAPVRAFSIDDASTTEIDDAFSVRDLGDGRLEIGIHIACPAIAIARGTPLDALARKRLSTVYMPGRKLTMLPDAVVDAFTLAEGRTPPALSLYVETDPEGSPLRHRTALERVPIAANLRHDALTESFAAPPTAGEAQWTGELRALWRLAQRLADKRGKTDVARIDYNFDVDWQREGAGEPGRVTITPRPRGNPLDRLVAELMIHVNHSFGRLLGLARIPGLYRVQSGGKVKMSTRPGDHQGLGVDHYLWASSPLRRYSDLVNQQQLLAVVGEGRAPYADNDPELFAALGDFEATYSQYADMQDRMEHYWCLRWLVQERVTQCTALAIRDTLVRFERLPLVVRLADMPPQPAGAPIRVAIGDVDLFDCSVECRFAGLAEPAESSPPPT